jgi:hypothetical protein
MKTRRWLALAVVAAGVLYGTLTAVDAFGLMDSPTVSDAVAAVLKKPESGLPASIEIEPDAVTINCGGDAKQPGLRESATITVRVRDARGKAVPNGTIVEFTSQFGDLSEQQVETRKGEATSTFTPFGYTPKPVVSIVTGELEASITLRCAPPEPCGPMSPPQAFSPPCETPPGCTPAFSPPQAFSPPCGTPTPIICDATSPPQAFSPPCATATPVPCEGAPVSPPCHAGAPLSLLVDCDLADEPIQLACQLPANARTLDAGVTLWNTSSQSIDVSVFQFELHMHGRWLLSPREGVDSNRNGNPDLNETAAGSDWTCTPPSPDPDTGEDGPENAVSFISCYLPGNRALALAPGERVLLAKVHYDVVGGANKFADLVIEDGVIATSNGEQYAPCGTARLDCGITGVVTEARGVVYYALDCDMESAGVQDECTLPGNERLDVAVVVINDETTPAYVCPPNPWPGCVDGAPAITAFQFFVHDPDTSLLNPPALAGDVHNVNPDFNEAALQGTWDCGTLAPDNDTGGDGPGKAVSRLACFNGIGGGVVPAVVAEGSNIVLGVVHYDYDVAAGKTGDVTLTLDGVIAGDMLGNDLGNCYPQPTGAPSFCLPATIHVEENIADVIEFPTATPTPGLVPIELEVSPACADVDRDGNVTEADVLMVIQHVGARDEAASGFDMNGDAKVTLIDVFVVARRVGGTC